MKKLLALFLVLALLLSGCGFVLPGTAETTTEDPEADSHANNLNPTNPIPTGFGLAYIPEYGFNPYSCTCITNRPVFSLVYEPLFVLGSGFQPEPVLCDRFAVSENGKNYVVSICEGITFSDGSALTARDVAVSLEAARNSDYYGTRFSKVASFTARDDRTLEISLEWAYENLPLLLDVPIVKAGTEDSDRPIGTGPYAFSEEEEEGLCLRRNQSWWQDNRAPVEYNTIELSACKDPTEVRDSFEFGKTTLVCVDLNAPNAVGYRCDYELWDAPTTTMQYLGFNMNSGVFYKRDLRAAVTHIIDRDSLIASVYKGFAQAACIPCAPASPLYDAELAEYYSYDVDAFAEALQDAAVSPEYTVTLLVTSSDPSRVELAGRIADTLTQAGLRTVVKAVDYETYRYRLSAGQFDLYLGEARLSGNFDLTEFFRAYGSLSYGGIRSAGMEQLCYDTLENSGNCYDLYSGVMENGYFCPLLFKSNAVMANRGAIGSLQPAVDCAFHIAGGRILADASVTYAELTEDPTEDDEDEEDPENPSNTEPTEEP